MINNSGYLAIVITNQPVIARGEVTTEELDRIHNKMRHYWERVVLTWMEFIIAHIIQIKDLREKYLI